TGLGLSISSRLVQSMQGQLQVDSEEGKGSRFYFTVQLTRTLDEDEDESQVDFQELTVLVVDDNAITRHFLFDLLTPWRCQVQLAESADAALAAIREAQAQRRAIDLILLDVCMPEKDGYMLASSLNESALRGDSRILLLSSAASLDEGRRCQELNIDGYIRKPLSPQELRFAIMQMPDMGGVEATAEIRKLEHGNARIPIIAMTANAMLGDKEKCIEAGMDYYLSKPIKSDLLRQLLDQVLQNIPRSDDPEFVALADATTPVEAGFNYAQALQSGDAEILAIITPMFLEACDQQVEEIRLAIASQQADDVYRTAHTLKGLVGNFNATPIEEATRALEQKGKAGDISDSEHLFARIVEEMPTLKIALKTYLDIPVQN
ncbi:MAG: response regulator, partial [Burkholderiales bacterium]|nr:response regulator [Burkholderiales bacterium]